MQTDPNQQTTGTGALYRATYTFNGPRRRPLDEAISRIRGTVTGMQDEGIDIGFLGATGKIDTAGKIVEVTARYRAPSEGAIGWLNWRAGFPASGSPQRTDITENTIDQKAIAAP